MTKGRTNVAAYWAATSVRPLHCASDAVLTLTELHVRDGLGLGQDGRDARAGIREDGADLADLALVDSSPHERVAQDRDEPADLGTQAAGGVAAAALPWGAEAAPEAAPVVLSMVVVGPAVHVRRRPTAPTPGTASAAPRLPLALGVKLRVGAPQRRAHEERACEEGQEASASESARRSIPGAMVAMVATGEGRTAGVERWVKVPCMMCVHLFLLTDSLDRDIS